MAAELESISSLVPRKVSAPEGLRAADLLGKVLTVESFYIRTADQARPLYRVEDGSMMTTARIDNGTPGEGWVEIYAREARTGERQLLEERVVAWDPAVPHDKSEIQESPALSQFVSELEAAGYQTIYRDEVPGLSDAQTDIPEL